MNPCKTCIGSSLTSICIECEFSQLKRRLIGADNYLGNIISLSQEIEARADELEESAHTTIERKAVSIKELAILIRRVLHSGDATKPFSSESALKIEEGQK